MSPAPDVSEALPPCAQCGTATTPLQRALGGALVCMPGHGCGVGRQLDEALGHDAPLPCTLPSCARPRLKYGWCAEHMPPKARGAT